MLAAATAAFEGLKVPAAISGADADADGDATGSGVDIVECAADIGDGPAPFGTAARCCDSALTCPDAVGEENEVVAVLDTAASRWVRVSTASCRSALKPCANENSALDDKSSAALQTKNKIRMNKCQQRDEKGGCCGALAWAGQVHKLWIIRIEAPS
jgi:hypothetical protein